MNKKRPPAEKSQSEKFKAMAKELEADDAAFDATLRKIAKAPKPPNKKKRKATRLQEKVGSA